MTTYGPRTATITVPNPFNPTYRVYRGYRSGYVQKPRTESPNPVVITRAAMTRPDLWNANCDAPNTMVAYRTQIPGYPGSPGSYGGYESVQALNRCYSKFKDAVYTSSAQLAANLAEYRSTVDMIADDAQVLRKAWNYLRRGQLGRFKELLRLKSRKGESPWSKPEAAGSLWLQYHFGWDPLVKDIHESIKVLESEFPSIKIAEKASSRGSYKLDDNYGGWNYDVPEFAYRVMMQARVRCSNPNLHRAQSLGLINPASVLWEIVPFSFVIDWFWPVGEFLDSWTDFVGLTFEDAFTTRSNKGFGHQYERALKGWGGFIITSSQQLSCKASHMERSLGILGPAFPYPKQFKGFSVVRGATAIALLVGALSNERRYFAQTASGRN